MLDSKSSEECVDFTTTLFPVNTFSGIKKILRSLHKYDMSKDMARDGTLAEPFFEIHNPKTKTTQYPKMLELLTFLHLIEMDKHTQQKTEI